MTLFARARSIKPATPLPSEHPAEQLDDSDVFVCKRDPDEDATVTLFVTGWNDVAPGPLSWAFPNMRAALDAVKKMRNAVEWSIVRGVDYTLDEARENGSVLIEQTR